MQEYGCLRALLPQEFFQNWILWEFEAGAEHTWPTEYCLTCLAVSYFCMNICLATILPMSLTEGSWQVEAWWWNCMQGILKSCQKEELYRDTVKKWGLQCLFNTPGVLTYKVNHIAFKLSTKFPYYDVATDKIYENPMATMHSKFYFSSITIYSNDVTCIIRCFYHHYTVCTKKQQHELPMPHVRKSLTHDGSSQFWFVLIQAHGMTYLSHFALFRVIYLVCMLKVS